MSFIQWIALSCVGTGAVVVLCGVVLAFLESRTYPKLSEGVNSLGDIASELSSKLAAKEVDASVTGNVAKTVGDTAQAFREVVRVAAGPAKSAPAVRLGVVLIFVGVGLTVVDYTVEDKSMRGTAPTTTVAPASTLPTTTTTVGSS